MSALTLLRRASTFPTMDPRALGRVLILCAALVSAAGCDTDRMPPVSLGQSDLFSASSMRVHPIFTDIKSLKGSERPDGIEAQVEFTDQFGDPTKASGRVLFELFAYVKDSPDPRGKRLGRWVASIVTPDEQRQGWNKTLRTYRFPLEYPEIGPAQSYVLTAVFELSTGGRFFDRIVLQGHAEPRTPHKAKSPLGEE